MSKPQKSYRRAEGDNALAAATLLAIHFGRWCDATEHGAVPPEPDQVKVESGEQVAQAFERIAGHLGLRDAGQRNALLDLLSGLANMMGDQGAELEGVLHMLLHPDTGPRHAMVLRLDAPAPADEPVLDTQLRDVPVTGKPN